MTTTTAHKRLAEIETHLTPQEWVHLAGRRTAEISRPTGAHEGDGQAALA